MPNDLPSGRLSHKPETTIEALTNRVARLQLRGGLGYEAADFFADILAYLASRPSAIVEEPMAVAWLHSNGAVVTPKDLADLKSRFDPEFGDITRDFKPLYTSPQPHTGRAGVTEAQPLRDLLTDMGRTAADPMWSDHVELSKAALKRWIATVRAALNAALTVEPEAQTRAEKSAE